MDQTVHEIESQIDHTRRRLGSNLKELEQRVDAATDWREQFRKRPFVAMGLACTGGLALAAAVRPRSSSRAVRPERRSLSHVDARGQVREVWDNLQTALIGVATAQVKDYVGAMMPGFDEHYRRAQQRRTPAPDEAAVPHGPTRG